MPLSIRAALYPLLGKRVRGGTGDVIDIFALVGTVFGVATSMGIGVVLLNVGFSMIFGLPEGLALQIALIGVAVVLTIAACTSGVDKGIRIISELNLWSAAAMMLYILVTGKTSFLLTALVENIGRFIFTLPERTLQTFAYESIGPDWMASWTLFFWLAWGPFVGMFLARISRGRTLREFVIAAITAPVLCDFFIVSIFGNSALKVVMDGNTGFAEQAIAEPEHGWYALLEMFPGAPFLIGLATLSGLLFYLTSANSGAMVMSNFSSTIPDPSQDGPKWLRIFWALATAMLTVAMLVAGGVTTMEHATLIFALPVTIIAYLVMASFSKVLRMERAEREGRMNRRKATAAHGGAAPDKTWRQRLAQLRSYPSNKQVARYVEKVIHPALVEVAQEFEELGYQAELSTKPNEQTQIPEHALVIHIPDHRDFHYQVAAVEAPVPMFGARSMSREIDVYFRLVVFTQTGSEGYDLMGLERDQVINDVLDRYETHLSFLRCSDEHRLRVGAHPAAPRHGHGAARPGAGGGSRNGCGQPAGRAASVALLAGRRPVGQRSGPWISLSAILFSNRLMYCRLPVGAYLFRSGRLWFEFIKCNWLRCRLPWCWPPAVASGCPRRVPAISRTPRRHPARIPRSRLLRCLSRLQVWRRIPRMALKPLSIIGWCC